MKEFNGQDVFLLLTINAHCILLNSLIKKILIETLAMSRLLQVTGQTLCTLAASIVIKRVVE